MSRSFEWHVPSLKIAQFKGKTIFKQDIFYKFFNKVLFIHII